MLDIKEAIERGDFVDSDAKKYYNVEVAREKNNE